MALSAINEEMVATSILKFREDVKWFEKNREELRKEHPDQFVAVLNKKIVTYGHDLKELLKKLDKMKIDVSSCLIEFLSEEDLILVL